MRGLLCSVGKGASQSAKDIPVVLSCMQGPKLFRAAAVVTDEVSSFG